MHVLDHVWGVCVGTHGNVHPGGLKPRKRVKRCPAARHDQRAMDKRRATIGEDVQVGSGVHDAVAPRDMCQMRKQNTFRQEAQIV